MTIDDTGAGPDTSRYLDYLLLNRDFTAPAVTAAVGSLNLANQSAPLRILDAGTGAGGALPELAELAARHDGGTVKAIDINPDAVNLAREQLAGHPCAGVVEFEIADLRDVAAANPDGFDLIWSSDVVWPATFDEPSEVVATLASALAPGGTFALFTTNYYRSMLLPGHSRLEGLIHTASELTWGLPDDGHTHYERLGAWLREAGLTDIALQAFTLTGLLRSDAHARDYAEQIAWPEMRHAVTSHGRAAGMSESDVARCEELLDPLSASWIGSDADAFVVQPTLLWTATQVMTGLE